MSKPLVDAESFPGGLILSFLRSKMPSFASIALSPMTILHPSLPSNLASLEDLINSRIIEARFDDVERAPGPPTKPKRELKELVEYYGTPASLKTIAQISTPDGSFLLVQPYDKSSLKDIEKAILNSDLGVTPNNDGEVIRLSLPLLTSERRKELSKVVAK